MKSVIEKKRRRLRRKKHIRKSIVGTSARPRVCVYRSNKHLYLQVIDDSVGNTIASVSNLEKDNRNLKTVVSDAMKIGEILGKKLKELSIDAVVFDRNGFKYHGVIKSAADGVRKAGIKF